MNFREEVLAVINGVTERELKLVRKEFTPITEDNDLLSVTGIDSLEYMVLYMWLGEIYGVDTKTFTLIESLGDVSFHQMVEFLANHATKQISATDALALYDAS